MSNAPQPVHVVTMIDLVAEAGGAETLAVELLDRLDRDRFRRTLVLYRHIPSDSPLRKGMDRIVARLRADGVEVLQLEGSSRWDLRSWGPFVGLLRGGGVDVLHTHKFGPNFWGALFARLARRVVFVPHEHTWSFEGRPLRKLIDRWVIARRAQAFLVVSERDRRRTIDLEGIPERKVRLLPNGIPKLVPNALDVRAEYGIPDGVPLIGAIGVYRAQKDFGTLLRAHARLREGRPEAHLIVVGDGPERPELERLRAELGLDGHVTFTGFRHDAVDVAARFDVAVNSSLFEGASLAILEFMALELPIVATAVGGTPELLGDGDAGVLVEPGRPDALATAIGALLDAPERAAALGGAAAARQRRIYDIDVQVRVLEGIYDELLAARRAG